MKTIFFQLVLCLIFINVSCVESNSQSSSNSNTAQTTNDMKWSIIISDNQCGIEVAKNVVIKSQKEYDDLWKECFQNMPTVEKAPAVDFTKEWVIGVFLGTINKGGHKVTVDSISSSESMIKVSTIHTKPGSNCLTTMAIEFPFAIVRVENSVSKKVDFETKDKIEECN
jgi:hypothetical protein